MDTVAIIDSVIWFSYFVIYPQNGGLNVYMGTIYDQTVHTPTGGEYPIKLIE